MPRRVFIAKIESFCVRDKKLFGVIHIVAFIGFVTLITLTFFFPRPSETANVWNSFAIFAREAIWTIWFPFVFISVVF